MFIVLGQAANVFTVGGMAYWGNDYLETHYQMDPTTAVLCFGGITISTGFAGTFLGSFILELLMKSYLDDFNKKRITEGELDDYRTIKSCQILVGSACSALVFACNTYPDPAIFSESPVYFLVFLALAEMCIFM